MYYSVFTILTVYNCTINVNRQCNLKYWGPWRCTGIRFETCRTVSQKLIVNKSVHSSDNKHRKKMYRMNNIKSEIYLLSVIHGPLKKIQTLTIILILRNNPIFTLFYNAQVPPTLKALSLMWQFSDMQINCNLSKNSYISGIGLVGYQFEKKYMPCTKAYS
jgi:hypothetical protein